MRSPPGGDRMGGILYDVQRERARQEEFRTQGKFPWTCAATEISAAQKLAVLAEEFGKVAKEVTELCIFEGRDYPDDPPELVLESKNRTRLRLHGKIRKELVQVAAVCVAWCEALDAEEEKTFRHALENELRGVVRDVPEPLTPSRKLSPTCCCNGPLDDQGPPVRDGLCSHCGMVVR